MSESSLHAEIIAEAASAKEAAETAQTHAAYIVEAAHAAQIHAQVIAQAATAAQAAQAQTDIIAKALSISERRYRRLFEAARDGIFILDPVTCCILDANPFMTELLGYSYTEFLGKELWEIGLLQDKEANEQAFLQLQRENYIRYENLPLRTRTGEPREVEFVSNLYLENEHTVIQCNIRDITERKRTEADLAAAATKHGQQAAVLAVLEERTRMAQEIHDTLAQGFTGITTQLEAAEASLAKVYDPVSPDNLVADQIQLGKIQSRIGKALDLARESLTEARRSVGALRSPTLEAAPLSETLALFITQSVLGTDVKSRFVLEGVTHALPISIEHCLLRIGQAAIANVVEHAQAQEIVVELSFETGQVRLSVHDDGRGFDPHFSDVGRFGIIGMRERAEKVQGKFTIVSHLGEGTDVDLTVPFPQDALI